MLTMRFLLPLMLAVAACWASIPPFEIEPPQAIEEISDNYRLPKDVVPTAYSIKLTPTFEPDNEKAKFTFQGESMIALNIEEITNTITFHAKGLKFKEINLTYINPKNQKEYKLINKLEVKEKDFVILTFSENLDKGENAKLYLEYTGKLNDETRGFFKSSYQDKENKTM